MRLQAEADDAHLRASGSEIAWNTLGILPSLIAVKYQCFMSELAIKARSCVERGRKVGRSKGRGEEGGVGDGEGLVRDAASKHCRLRTMSCT